MSRVNEVNLYFKSHESDVASVARNILEEYDTLHSESDFFRFFLNKKKKRKTKKG